MNNKITKQRLKTFLVYDLVKMVAITTIVLLCVIIIFNYFGKRPSEGQTFSVLIDGSEVITGDGEEDFYSKVTNGREDKYYYGLSYNILDGNVTTISPSSANPMETLVQTYTQLKDDDVVIAGKTVATYYLGRGSAMNFDTFISDFNSFLYVNNGFYASEASSVEDINVEAVKTYFLKTYAKDARFLSESQKQKGIEQEIERIKGFKTNSDLFKKLLEVCPNIVATEQELSSFTLGGIEFSGKYALNLGALGNDFINVYKTEQAGNEEEPYSTNGVYLLLGNRTEGDAMFETLSFILTLAKEYSNVLEG
ncbi:MAG: hypothetical protein IKV61_02290 [Clostridia bacterium]|nr:hypothetical protein [Clostridia bacterium]